jgi:carbamoyltransferase
MIDTILGVHDGHNAAAALLKKGRIIAAVQEERLSRSKNHGGIPAKAIEEILSTTNIKTSELDQIALNGKYMRYDDLEPQILLEGYEHSGGWASQLRQTLKGTLIDDIYQKSKAQERYRQLSRVGFCNGKVTSAVHHAAHASAAYYGSGWRGKVLVLTCDGSGDRVSATVNIGDNGHLERIASISEQDSIGRIYSMVTYYLGMMPLEHEYKIMGLAPYIGNHIGAQQQDNLFGSLFEFDVKNPLVWRRRKGVPPISGAYGLIRKLLYRRRFDFVAAALQQFIEDMLNQWVRNCVRETGIKRVACGGGVFMNIKANKEILTLPEIEELFVFPSCGDESNSMGAAFSVYAQECMRSGKAIDIEPIGPIYWGRTFDDAEAEEALQQYESKNPIHFDYVENIEKLTAEHLAAGEVVARAKGPMEFGARALGNRSILARADNFKLVSHINDMIKNRDFWMPFAPAVLIERAKDYYIKPKPMPAPYMMIAFDSRPETRALTSAVQHPRDYSLRPQEVSEVWNSDFYRLLKYYEEITGEGIILNTSFNLHGYPIVYKPLDAIKVFDHSGLQYLALGNWWVRKKETLTFA